MTLCAAPTARLVAVWPTSYTMFLVHRFVSNFTHALSNVTIATADAANVAALLLPL